MLEPLESYGKGGQLVASEHLSVSVFVMVTSPVWPSTVVIHLQGYSLLSATTGG